MKILFVADLHYALKQFDWLMANAARFEVAVIGGDLLDLGSALEIDVQIVVMEEYLVRLRGQTHVIVSSGNHDGDERLASSESICNWLHDIKGGNQRYHVPDCAVDNCPNIPDCPALYPV